MLVIDDGFSDRFVSGEFLRPAVSKSKPKTNPILVNAKRHHLTHSNGQKKVYTTPFFDRLKYKIIKDIDPTIPDLNCTKSCAAKSSNLTLAPRGMMGSQHPHVASCHNLGFFAAYTPNLC
jgi:hypothetical protein